jgi:hypothetical protein
MAILGNMIDKQSASIAPGDDPGVILSTVAHSCGTTPEIGFVSVRSIQAMGGNGTNGIAAPFWVGANASICTVGFVSASSPSIPICYYDVINMALHSMIR